MTASLHNDCQFTVTVAPQTSRGRTAKIDGVPVWSTNRADLITIAPAADGLSAVVAAVGGVGSAEVTVVADANLGPEKTDISVILEVNVIDAEAALLGISVSAETPIPTPEV